MASTDDTKKIAKQYTDKVYDHPYVGYVEPARNFALSKASGNWALIVDADERIPTTLAGKLVDIATNDEADFVRVPRKNLVFGQWLKYSRWWPDYNIRFFKRGYVEWQDAIHRPPITTGQGINLDPDPKYALIHHHYRTLDEYLERLIRYTDQQAKELLAEGYKDGLHGLAISLLQAFSTFVVYLRTWQEEGFTPQKDVLTTPVFQKLIGSKFRELKYWLYTVKIHLSGKKSERFALKIKRKLNL